MAWLNVDGMHIRSPLDLGTSGCSSRTSTVPRATGRTTGVVTLWGGTGGDRGWVAPPPVSEHGAGPGFQRGCPSLALASDDVAELEGERGVWGAPPSHGLSLSGGAGGWPPASVSRGAVAGHTSRGWRRRERYVCGSTQARGVAHPPEAQDEREPGGDGSGRQRVVKAEGAALRGRWPGGGGGVSPGGESRESWR
jgi:hypothetical protein